MSIKTRQVTIVVTLPEDVADQCDRERATTDGLEFLSRCVLYGLCRRSIYRHLKEQRELAQAMEHAEREEMLL